MPTLKALPASGNYTLVVHLESPSRIMVPHGCRSQLRQGYYAYTGSAVGRGAVSLRQRVARHLRGKKTQHWHIDHLLACPEASVIAVVTCAGTISKECEINKAIQNIRGAMIPIEGFGASDCQQNCKSHLVYSGQNDICETVVGVYRRLSREVKVLRVA